MVRVFSFGGGVQSVAALVLAVAGRLQYDAFVFANVGEDSENPATLEYLREVARPYAEKHGIELAEVRKVDRAGQVISLLQYLLTRETSIILPVRMNNRAPGRRGCTRDFKIKPVAKWLRLERGASRKEPAVVGMGISLDEYRRMHNNSMIPWETLEYPLIDLKLTREDCIKIIDQAGLPIPEKSSCWFCPNHTLAEWVELSQVRPALFVQAVGLERLFIRRRAARGKEPVWLSNYLRPLPEVITGKYKMTRPVELCEAGYCMT
jgi:hypothetical protein